MRLIILQDNQKTFGWGPLTLEQFEGNMYFLSTEDGRNFKILVNQVFLRDYVPGMT